MDTREENSVSSSSENEEVSSVEKLSIHENKPGLYIIYSKWSLSRIDKQIKLFGKIGLLRIICDGGKETNRTLALLENDVYDRLCEKGYDNKKGNRGFSISRFNEKALDLPQKGCSRNLFIPVPEVFRKDDMKTIDIIDDKLKHLVEWEVLSENSWHVNALLESREKGAISSGCFIVFDSTVELVTIAKVKLLITDNFWPLVSEDLEREQFKCLWAFDSKKKEHKKEDREEKRTTRKIKGEEKEEEKEKRTTRKIKGEEKEEEKEKRPIRKIKAEVDDDKEERVPLRKIKSESKTKKYVQKIKPDDEQKPAVVLSIPTTIQPVEMLDDIVTEEIVTEEIDL